MKMLKNFSKSNSIIDINIIKIIAALSMVIDHIGYMFFPNLIIFRIIGRMSFILYSFCLAEGMKHTKSQKKYLIRLIILALISEIPFDLFLSGKIINVTYQNVIFTYILAFMGIMAREKYKNSYGNLFLAVPIIVSIFINCDFGLLGILVIYSFYFFGNSIKGCLLASIIMVIINYSVLKSIAGVLFSLIILLITSLIIIFYSGKKSNLPKPVITTINLFYPINYIVLLFLAAFTIN